MFYKKKLLILLCCFCFMMNCFTVSADIGEMECFVEEVKNAEEKDSFSELTSPSVCLMEMETGAVIYGRNMDEKRSPASITKIMTLLLAMEEIYAGTIQYSDEITVSAYAASMGGSQVFLEEGEKQTLDTMLKCIAVSSANDASVAVAEYIGGSESNFVKMMNEKAEELGMDNTHFEDCCGLSDSDEHYTSAKDVAIMAKELMWNYPDIKKYTQIWMEDITHHTRRGDSTFTLSSTNKLLKQNSNVTGLKTGSTSKAKYCFCATAAQDDENMIAVVLGCENPKKRFAEANELIQYGFANTEKYTDFNEDALPKVSVKRGDKELVLPRYEEKFVYISLSKGREELTKKIKLFPYLEAPVLEGDLVGIAEYYLSNQKVGEVNILAGENVKQRDFTFCFGKLFHDFLL